MSISFAADERSRSLTKDIATFLREELGVELTKSQYQHVHSLIKGRYEDVEELAWMYDDLRNS